MVQFISVSLHDTRGLDIQPAKEILLNPAYSKYSWIDQITCKDGSILDVAFLRDSGAQQSVLSKKKASDVDYKHTDEFRLVREVGGAILKVSVIEVKFSKQVGSWSYLSSLTESLPD